MVEKVLLMRNNPGYPVVSTSNATIAAVDSNTV